MGVDFGVLMIDLEELASSSLEDFVNEFWSSYEDYIKKYNNILMDLQSLGFYKSLKSIEEVSLSDQSFGSGYSKQEQAKLREVANASQSLLKKVKLLLSPKSEPRFNSEVRSNKIFLVYGQDDEMKNDVTQTLRKLDLEPVILNQTSDNKQTLIEQISECTYISFAVVLVSPEELACSKQGVINEARYVVNQDVIFALGYLLGKLGTQNVAVVYRGKQNFQIPDNYNIQWIEYKTGWYLKLIKELEVCNFNVDANKLDWI